MKCLAEVTPPVGIIGRADATPINNNNNNDDDAIASSFVRSPDSSYNDSDLHCGSLDSTTSDTNDTFIEQQLRPLNKHHIGTKNRLISIDSGFESIGKSTKPIVDTNLSTIEVSIDDDDETHDIIHALKSEQDRENCDLDKCDIVKEKFKKNRTTTLNTFDDSILDPLLINKSDGLQDVLYYVDENGSPKIREKFSRKAKQQKETEGKKNLTYGTEECIDTFLLDDKTPSCVSFSWLFRKMKASFRK